MPAPAQAGARSPALAGLLGDMSVANLYMRLLCQYEPRSGGLLLGCVLGAGELDRVKRWVGWVGRVAAVLHMVVLLLKH